MANTIQIKRSSTASATPTAGQLSAGELAINTADGRLFAKNSAGTVVNLPVTSISGQTITPNTVGINVSSPTSKLHVKHSETANGQDSVAKLLSSSTTTSGDTEWKGRTLLGAQNKTFLLGCFKNMAAIGAHSWTSADSQTGAAWADMYFNPDGAAKIYLGAVPGEGWTPDQGIMCVDNSTGKVGLGTNSPQANFQTVVGFDQVYSNIVLSPLSYDTTYTRTTSTLYGAGQSEILQVIHGGYEYDSGSEAYFPNEYVNLARFHCNGAASRGSFSLSNSGVSPPPATQTGAWENNVLQFFVHGRDYAPGYYGGNSCDAGCAMIVTQGGDIQKLQIGNYNSAPIEFFTNNTKRFRIRASDGNYDIYTDLQTDFAAGAAFVWYNVYDGGSGETGELAAIQVITGSSPDQGTLAFYTGAANALAEQVRIDQDGNLGVGTGTPSQKLHVVGTALVSKIIVGANSTAAGTSAASVSGDNNTASASYATAAGYQAVADRYGIVAQASGRFAADGDAQAIRATLRNSTTNATPTTLFLDGSSTRLTIPSGKALFATVQISGIINGGSKGAHYVRKVAIKNVAGTTALIGTVSTVGTDVEDDAAYDVSITADNTNDALQINVTGKAAETIRWVALVDGTEIKYG